MVVGGCVMVVYLQYRDPEAFTLLDGFPISTEVITGREQLREFHQCLKYATTHVQGEGVNLE